MIAPFAALPLDRAGSPDLLLQEKDTVKQRLGGGRTARHVDVDRDHPVAAAHHGVGIVVVAAAVGARSHGDDVARLRHLVVDLAQRGRHLVGQRAGDDHHVRLARRGPRGEAEALHVVARHGHLHHLDRAAGETERHPHERAGAGPGDEVLRRGHEEALVGEFVVDVREEGVVAAGRPTGSRIDDAAGGRGDERRLPIVQSHSSAPFLHS